MSEYAARPGSQYQPRFHHASAKQVRDMMELEAVLLASDVAIRPNLDCPQYLSYKQAATAIRWMKADLLKDKKAKGLVS